MKTLPVGEFKTHFSEVIDDVRAGEEIVITYGKKKEQVAVVIPYSLYKKRNQIKLGLLKNNTYKIHDSFAMTEEELLDL
jgi:prevent-host-death family protein